VVPLDIIDFHGSIFQKDKVIDWLLFFWLLSLLIGNHSWSFYLI